MHTAEIAFLSITLGILSLITVLDQVRRYRKSKNNIMNKKKLSVNTELLLRSLIIGGLTFQVLNMVARSYLFPTFDPITETLMGTFVNISLVFFVGGWLTSIYTLLQLPNSRTKIIQILCMIALSPLAVVYAFLYKEPDTTTADTPASTAVR